jgi:excisionase family DNA binding protein
MLGFVYARIPQRMMVSTPVMKEAIELNLRRRHGPPIYTCATSAEEQLTVTRLRWSGEKPSFKEPEHMGKSEEFYRAQELAAKLRVNVMTIYRYIKVGKLKAYKFGKEFRITNAEFDKFLSRAKTK